MADSIRHGCALAGNHVIPDALPISSTWEKGCSERALFYHRKLTLRRTNHAIAYSKNRLVSWTEWLPSPEGSKRRNLTSADDMQGVPVRL